MFFAHKLIDKGELNDIVFFDIEFILKNQRRQIFRLLFAPLADDPTLQEQLDCVLKSPGENHLSVVVSFYDKAYEDIPFDSLDGKSPFDKIDTSILMNKSEHTYFFKTLILFIEVFIKKSKVSTLVFRAFSSSHSRTYERILLNYENELVLKAEILAGGSYVITTKYYDGTNSQRL